MNYSLNNIDRSIAEEIMGWKLWNEIAGIPYWATERGAQIQKADWHPCRNILQAWEIVEKLRDSWLVQIKDCGPFGWCVELHSTAPGFADIRADADTMPLAVCMAALKTKGYRF